MLRSRSRCRLGIISFTANFNDAEQRAAALAWQLHKPAPVVTWEKASHYGYRGRHPITGRSTEVLRRLQSAIVTGPANDGSFAAGF